MNQLLAGASKIVISPKPEILPLPQSVLNGDAWYTKIRKDIFARAIAVNNGQQQLLLIAVEGGISNSEIMKERIAKENNISIGSIILVSEHTHTQPSAPALTAKEDWGIPIEPRSFEYSRFMIDQIVAVAGDAIKNMRPARYGFGKGNSYINASRDEQLPDGRWIFGRNLERPSDKTLGVVEFVDLDGKVIAVMLNYAVHSTMCFRVKDEEGNMAVSGDLAGEISEYVEEAYKADGTVCAWTMGTAGNQTPVLSFFHIYNPDGTYEPDERFNRFLNPFVHDLCRHLGQKQGSDAVQIMKGIKKFSTKMQLNFVDRKLELPGTKVMGFGKPELLDDRLIDNSKIYNVDTDDKIPVILKLVTMGDLALFCTSGEVMCETGLRLKASSPFKNTLILTCYNTQGGGYQVDKWGYENRTPSYYRNKVRNACYEEKVTEAMHEMFDEILNK